MQYLINNRQYAAINMVRVSFCAIFIAFLLLFFVPKSVFANNLPDSDRDGVPDADEIGIYHTEPNDADTDSDDYSDWEELKAGYSPLNPTKVKLEDCDYDNDGLSDRMELNFKTDLTNPDTDSDGLKDGDEISSGNDPLSKEKALLVKRIEVNTGKQELSYFLGDVRLGSFPISSGKHNSTPLGQHTVRNKSPKAWSPYGLWMPYWLGIDSGYFGIHELPIWPSGYREGEDHLGKPVSHGCIRLGVGPAKFMYDWTPVGIGVFIY